jgi:high-affinity nickel permease
MKNIKSLFVLVVLLMVANASAFAQCAMCKTTAESDLNNGGSIGTGLNTGILYLMTIPYIILITGAYFFFKKPIDAKMKEWKNKRFPSKSAK